MLAGITHFLGQYLDSQVTADTDLENYRQQLALEMHLENRDLDPGLVPRDKALAELQLCCGFVHLELKYMLIPVSEAKVSNKASICLVQGPAAVL